MGEEPLWRPPPTWDPDDQGMGTLKGTTLSSESGQTCLLVGPSFRLLGFNARKGARQGRGRPATETGSCSSLLLCPWPWIVPGQKLRGPQWGLGDAWRGCYATPTQGPFEGCPLAGPGPKAPRPESGKLLLNRQQQWHNLNFQKGSPNSHCLPGAPGPLKAVSFGQ